jgi:hypothetical protein
MRYQQQLYRQQAALPAPVVKPRLLISLVFSFYKQPLL